MDANHECSGRPTFSEPTHQLGTSVSLQVPCKAQGQYLCPDLPLLLSQFLQGGQRYGFGVGVCQVSSVMSDSVRPYGLQPARQDGIISFLWFKMESKLLHVEDHVLPTSKLCGFTLLLNYFILGDSKITADGDCSHEIKRRLLLGRKAMTNLDSILKSRDITLPTKVHLVKAMVFVVDVYQCESRNIKKAECQSIDVFELWCWKDSWESLGLHGDQTSQS